MKQIFLASSAFEIITLAAALDANVFETGHLPAIVGGGIDPAYPSPSERILLVTDNSFAQELTPRLDSAPDLAPLIARFDRVLSLNELLYPIHPSHWSPREDELPMLERQLRSHWQLGVKDVELILESPQVNPSIALARVFRSSFIRVYADGLMTYGPTRTKVPLHMGQRLTSLHYLPLVDGVAPRLLLEYSPALEPIDLASFEAVLEEYTANVDFSLRTRLREFGGDQTALVVGQYLAALGILSAEEEVALHVEMIDAAADAGMERVLFKPHPSAPPAATQLLVERAAERSLTLEICTERILAESVMALLRPGLVIGGFSTALATARTVFHVPVRSVGLLSLQALLAPYQNSNRVPVVLTDVLASDDERIRTVFGSSPAYVQQLLDTVSYCMQPDVASSLRTAAMRFLDSLPADLRKRWFKTRRLTALGLPGATPRRMLTRTRARTWSRISVEFARLHAKPVLQRAVKRR